MRIDSGPAQPSVRGCVALSSERRSVMRSRSRSLHWELPAASSSPSPWKAPRSTVLFSWYFRRRRPEQQTRLMVAEPPARAGDHQQLRWRPLELFEATAIRAERRTPTHQRQSRPQVRASESTPCADEQWRLTPEKQSGRRRRPAGAEERAGSAQVRREPLHGTPERRGRRGE